MLENKQHRTVISERRKTHIQGKAHHFFCLKELSRLWHRVVVDQPGHGGLAKVRRQEPESGLGEQESFTEYTTREEGSVGRRNSRNLQDQGEKTQWELGSQWYF